MTRVAIGNVLVREIVFRERRGLDYESEYTTRSREVQLRIQLRYEMQFRNEPCQIVTIFRSQVALWSLPTSIGLEI